MAVGTAGGRQPAHHTGGGHELLGLVLCAWLHVGDIVGHGQLARFALGDVDPKLFGHDLDVTLHREVHAVLALEYVHAEVVDDRVLVEIDWGFDLEARAEHLEEPSNMLAPPSNE